MRGFDRSRAISTHTGAPGTTIAERSGREVGVEEGSTTLRGGLKSGEHYTFSLRIRGALQGVTAGANLSQVNLMVLS